jgi:hypothetical protein
MTHGASFFDCDTVRIRTRGTPSRLPEPLNGETVNDQAGHPGDILAKEPIRRGLRDDARKLCEHPDPVTRGRPAPGPGEVLTRRTTDHAIEAAGWASEILDALTEDNIRTAHDAKACRFKTSAK